MCSTAVWLEWGSTQRNSLVACLGHLAEKAIYRRVSVCSLLLHCYNWEDISGINKKIFFVAQRMIARG